MIWLCSSQPSIYREIFGLLKRYVEDLAIEEKDDSICIIYQVEPWDEPDLFNTLPRVLDDLVQLLTKTESGILISTVDSPLDIYDLDFAIVVPSEQVHDLLREFAFQTIKYQWELTTWEMVERMSSSKWLEEGVLEHQGRAVIVKGEPLQRKFQELIQEL